MIIVTAYVVWTALAIVVMTYKVEDGKQPGWVCLAALPLLPLTVVLGLIPTFNRHNPNAINF